MEVDLVIAVLPAYYGLVLEGIQRMGAHKGFSIREGNDGDNALPKLQ